MGPPSSWNCTATTPETSPRVVYVTSIVVPYTTAFWAGCVISSVAGLFTDTVTSAEVVVLPAASRARAAIVYVPFGPDVLFHVIEYGAAVSSEPADAPLTR